MIPLATTQSVPVSYTHLVGLLAKGGGLPEEGAGHPRVDWRAVGGGLLHGDAGVADDLGQGDVAADAGDGLDVEVRAAQGHDQGHRVVGGGVGVKEDVAHQRDPLSR